MFLQSHTILQGLPVISKGLNCGLTSNTLPPKKALKRNKHKGMYLESEVDANLIRANVCREK